MKKPVKIPNIVAVKAKGAKFRIKLTLEQQAEFKELYKKDLDARGIAYIE